MPRRRLRRRIDNKRIEEIENEDGEKTLLIVPESAYHHRTITPRQRLGNKDAVKGETETTHRSALKLVNRAQDLLFSVYHKGIPSLPASGDISTDILEALKGATSILQDLSGRVPATHVFNLPELLEIICGHLSAIDLLRAQQVNRRFRDTIQRSVEMQGTMGTRFTVGQKLTIPLGFALKKAGIEWVYTDVLPTSNGRAAVLVRFYSHDKVKMPRLGSRAGSILLTQPPVDRITLYPLCCNRPAFCPGPPPPPSFKTFCSASGVTIGQLFALLDATAKEHRLCPLADILMYDKDGYVVPGFTIEATVTLPRFDATIAAIQRQWEKENDARLEAADQMQRLEQYVMAKRSAYQQGRPIPTQREYEESLQMDEPMFSP